MISAGPSSFRRCAGVIEAPWTFDASTPSRQRALSLARRVAPSSCAVLILGPTGVGKEVLASDVHSHSPRAGAPFIPVNCAAISPALFESTFFGHVRGAFTGATSDKPGLVELANGGTLFLDEVGELPMESQAKLLRFLAQGTYWPVGAASERRSDVRIISATHRRLDEEAGRSFREDLFYRLSVVLVHIPRLDPGDVHLIARSLAVEAMERHKSSLPAHEIERLASFCRAREWRGGARELRNAIERFMVLWSEDRSSDDDFAELLGVDPSGVQSAPGPRVSSTDIMKALDNLVFLGIASQCVDVRQLAERTDRTVQAVYGRLRKLGLGPQDVGKTPGLIASIERLRRRVAPDLPWLQALLAG